MSNKGYQPTLSVDFRHYFDDMSDGVSYQSRVCVSIDAIHGGLISTIGANRFSVLMAIMAFMDTDGKAFPSQRKLATMTGQSVNTVNKLINELIEIEFQGKHILKRELVGDGFKKKSMYYISDGIVTNTEEEEKPEEKKPLNSRDYVQYFAEMYEKEFGKAYVINYARDVSLVKNKLTDAFDEETLLGIIEVTISEYRKRWATDRYPVPTIGAMCSWIANEAQAIYEKAKKEEIRQAEKINTAKEQDETDRALELF